MDTFSEPRVVCRPALPSDKTDVVEFCKTIWDGHDYVPSVWDEWFADPEGLMATAEFGGKTVGMGKITHPAPGQWWLEGLRVDPNHQGRGISSLLNDYLINWWLENGDGIARLMTSSKRIKVHHLMARCGFTKVLDDTMYAAPPISEPADSFTPVALDEIDGVLAVLQESETLDHWNGYIDTGWLTVTPNSACLRKAISESRALWWRGRSGLLIHWFDDEGDARIIMLEALACKNADAPALLEDYRRLAAQVGSAEAGGFLPVGSGIAAMAETIGYTTKWNGESLFIYERVHPTRP